MCKRILKHQTNSENGVPFYKIGTFGKTADAFISEELYNQYKEKYNYPKKGDILISAAGTLGQIVVYDGKPAYFQDSNIVWLKHNEKNVLNKFLFYVYATNPWKVPESSTIPRLYNDNILNICILVPPLPEQEKMAEILGTWDLAIEKLTALIEQKKLLKKGLMQRLLTGKQRLPGFSAPWKKLKLGDFLEIKHGKNQKAIECQNGIFPILATGGEIGRTNTFIYDKPSVLIGRKGTINKPQYIETPFWTVDTLFWSKMKETNIAKFFYYLFQMIKWEVWDEGSTIPSLNASTIMSIKIKISDNVSEQKAIADILSKADEEIDLLTAKLSALKSQKKGLMQKLLTGQIRVKLN